MDIKVGLLLWFTNFFDKKSSGSGVNMHTNNKTKQNHQLAEELHKPIIKKIKKERFI